MACWSLPATATASNTFVGRGIGRFNDDLDYQNGQSMRWSISMQRELPGQWVVEGAYVASRSYDLTTDYNLNRAAAAVPLDQPDPRDQATIDFLSANVTNPFRGLLPGEESNSNTRRSVSTCCARIRSSGHRRPPLRWIEQLRLGAVPHHEAVPRRISAGYRAIPGPISRRQVQPAQRDRHRLRGAVQRHAPAAPAGVQRHLGAAVRPRPEVRQRCAPGRQRLYRQLERLGDLELADRAARTCRSGNVYYNGDITQLKTNYTNDPTVPVFDISGFYFHDAAVQTNGVDDPAKQRADQRIRLANNIRTLPSRWDASAVRATPTGTCRS